jgi:hypothetical protein
MARWATGQASDGTVDVDSARHVANPSAQQTSARDAPLEAIDILFGAAHEG